MSRFSRAWTNRARWAFTKALSNSFARMMLRARPCESRAYLATFQHNENTSYSNTPSVEEVNWVKSFDLYLAKSDYIIKSGDGKYLVQLFYLTTVAKGVVDQQDAFLLKYKSPVFWDKHKVFIDRVLELLEKVKSIPYSEREDMISKYGSRVQVDVDTWKITGTLVPLEQIEPELPPLDPVPESYGEPEPRPEDTFEPLTIPKPESTPVKPTPVPEPASAPMDYRLPSVDLLTPPDRSRNHRLTDDQLRENLDLIVKTLMSFGVISAPGDITPGAMITRYEVYPAFGVRLDEISV